MPSGGVTEAELTRVKTRWVAGEVYKLDSVMNQARELGSQWALGLPLDAGERLIQRLRGVTAQQVQAVAAKYFGDDQLTVGVLRPQPVDKNRKPRAAPTGSGSWGRFAPPGVMYDPSPREYFVQEER